MGYQRYGLREVRLYSGLKLAEIVQKYNYVERGDGSRKTNLNIQLSRYSRTESSPIPEATYTSGGTKSDTMRILGLIFSRYTRQSRVPGAVDARCGPIRSCATSFVKGSRYYIRTPPSSSVYGEHDADAIAVSFHSVGHSEIFDLSDFQHSEI
jgi:hypothetical protein